MSSSSWEGVNLENARPVDPSQHPMGSHLWDYVAPKVHHLIRDREWTLIVVVGKYNREQPYIVSDNEKSYKSSNWHRPTARIVDNSVLEVACFPGHDYIKHYALVIATYLEIAGKCSTPVKYSQDVSSSEIEALLSLHLEGLGELDTVAVGYVDRLDVALADAWRHGSLPDGIFAWQNIRTTHGQTITLLSCQVSFWGDISSQLIKALSKLGMRRFLYVGKAGTLIHEYRPNETCATGSSSFLGRGRVIDWENAFGGSILKLPQVRVGAHITIASPLLGDWQWVKSARALGAVWVDCEVGLMAEACRTRKIAFGFFHLVSDKLSVGETYGLWNERIAEVERRRSSLLGIMSSVLDNVESRNGHHNGTS